MSLFPVDEVKFGQLLTLGLETVIEYLHQ